MDSPDDYSVGRGFSILLKRYRREIQGWTQQELANKSGLKIRTIQDLETAQKAKLDHEIIAKLSEAFELNGSAKEAFFGAAGLSIVAPTQQEIEWKRVIYEFHKKMNFPAFVSNELTEVISVNSYIVALLGMNLEIISDILHTSDSFNAIQFFLDPVFNTKKLYGREWKAYTTTNAVFLRTMSRPYIHTVRYQKLMSELQAFDEFEEIWEATEHFIVPEPPYHATIYHPKYGKVSFLHSASVKPSNTGAQITFLFYLPADEPSEQIFAQLRADVPKMAYQLSDTRGKGIVRII
jgi:transcriptional regulator with XRE-family HTH domain